MKDQDLSSIIHHLQGLKVAEKADGLGAQAMAERVHAFVMGNISTSHLTNVHIPNNTAEMTGENNLGENTDELHSTTTSNEGYMDPSDAPFPHLNYAARVQQSTIDNVPSQTPGKF